MNKIVLIAAIAFSVSTISLSRCTPSSEKMEQPKKKELYQCPMDCESGKTYGKPGKCPVCEMDMEKLEKQSI